VQFSTADGTATSGLDYTGVTNVLTFPQGETFRSILVPILDDDEIEPVETVLLALSNPTGGASVDFPFGFQRTAVLNIVSDDSRIEFQTATYSVSESVQTGFATIFVTRSGATNTTVSVDFATVPGGTATEGLDYVSVAGTIRFAPGETLRTFTIPIINDTQVEPKETVFLELSNPAGAVVLGRSQAVLEIIDDEVAAGELSFSAMTYTVNEDQARAVITVVRTNGFTGIVSVDYATADGTARAGSDYEATSGVLSFADGVSMRTFEVPIINDSELEPAETVLLRLFNPSGGAVLGAITNATLIIEDDDSVPVMLSFSSPAYTVNEGDGTATITVVRSGPGTEAASVNYATVFGGTATPNEDYVSTTGTLTWGAGDLSPRTFAVTIVNDQIGEANETVLLALSNPSPGARLGQSSATLTIVDDDITLHFSSAEYSVLENAGTATITVQRRGVAAGAVSVDYATLPGGTAVPGVNYTAVNGQLTWGDGDLAPKTFTIPVIDNSLTNPDLTVLLGLSNPTGPAGTRLGAPAAATLTIIDDENLSPPGSVDPAFNARLGANGPVYAVLLTPAEQMIAGGDFTFVNGMRRNRLVRLNATGSVDRDFDIGSGANAPVHALLLDSSGRVLVGGQFTTLNGIARNRVARLNTDGSVDTSFNPGGGAAWTVYALGTSSLSTMPVSAAGTGSNTNVINTGVTAGFIALDYSFQGTNTDHSLRIYYGNVLIANETNKVNGTVNAPFGPGQATDLTIIINEGNTNSVDTTWNYNGTITLGAPGDEQVYVGGSFPTFDGAARNGVARLNSDGSLDTSFIPGNGANGAVYAIRAVNGGQVVVAGNFTVFNGNQVGRIALLNNDGSIDSNFNSGLGANAAINSIAVQRDGKILIGGDFTSYDGATRNYVARLHPDGTLDTTFDPGAGADGPVRSVAIQGDGQIVLSGAFTTYNGEMNNRIVRLNPDGTTDASFDAGTGADAVVHSVAVDTAMRTFTAGAANSGAGPAEHRTTIDVGATVGVVTVTYDFLCVPDTLTIYYGTDLIYESGLVNNFSDLDCFFGEYLGPITVVVPFGPGTATTITIVINEGSGDPGTVWDYTATITTGQRLDSRIAMGGNFSEVNGQPRSRLALLNNDGSVNLGFNPALSGINTINAVVLYTNTALPQLLGRFIIGGDFTAAVGAAQNRVARLMEDGSLDSSFDPGAGPNNSVRAVALQNDGRVVIGGFFNQVNTSSRGFLARLGVDGSVDPFFNSGAGFNNAVYALAQQANGGILVGGLFTTYNGSSRNFLARLQSNGLIDVGFNPVIDGPVRAIAVQVDGRIVIAGDFQNVNGVIRNRMARLNANGSLDLSFDPGLGPNAFVNSIVIQPDGRILIGGGFTFVDGNPYNRVARLNANGTVDASFNPGAGANDPVSDLALQANGKILVAGSFTMFDGRSRNRITRLNPDGSQDPTINFGSGANNFTTSVLVQPWDGKIVVAGAFTEFSGIPRNAIARLFGGEHSGGGTLHFSAPAYSVAENGTVATITVLRSGGTIGTVSVNFATGGGTAIPGTDYVATSGTLVFPPGEAVQTIDVRILDNATLNPDKTVNLTLSGVSGGALLGSPSTAVLTILENESVIAFSSGNYFVNEDGGSARITLSRTGGSTEFASVQAATILGGTATPGADYFPVSTRVNFPPGVNVQIFTIPIFDDVEIEGNETVFMVLSDPLGSTTLGLTNAVLTILDNDFSPGTVSFSTNVFWVVENDGPAVVTVIRTNGATGRVAVNYAATSGNPPSGAMAGQDFVATSGLLVFEDGETNKTFTVTIINDQTPEGPETINLTLSNPTSGAVLGVGTAVLVIEDDDSPGLFGFTDPVYFVEENATNALITVRRSHGSMGAATVNYATIAGTATPGVDYVATSGTLQFGAGEILKSFTVRILDDLLVEGDETVTLILSNATGGAMVGSQNSSTLVILDNDVSFSFAASSFRAGEAAGQAVISVHRLGRTNDAVSVRYSTGDGTAIAGLDYLPASGLLSFGPGQTNQTFTVQIIDDTLVEGDEIVNLTLSNPSAGATLGPQINAALIIEDNDVSFNFAQATFTVIEGDLGPFGFPLMTQVTIPVIRSGLTNSDVAVDFRTADGTAIEGIDYFGASGNLFFPAGVVSNSFTMTIIGDLLVEGDETVNLILFNPSAGTTIGSQGTALLLILDDDVGVGFAQANYVVDEQAGTALITVLRNGSTTNSVTVNYMTSAGPTNSATAGVDYVAASGTLVFAPGVISNSFSVTILTDSILEGSETITLSLINPSGAVLTRGMAILTIVDDAGTIGFSAAGYTFNEGDSGASITLLRTGGTNGSVTVTLTSSNATAVAGQDFEMIDFPVAFGHGESSRVVHIPIIDDNIAEGIENFQLRLSNPTGGARIGNPNVATVTILDNDLGIITTAGSTLISESFSPPNSSIDVGETVTMRFALRNTGIVSTTNLIATLQATGGVDPQTSSQNYGAISAGGGVVSRDFTFRATGASGSMLTVTLVLTEGPFNLGTVTFRFIVGGGMVTFQNAGQILIHDFAPATPYPSMINVSGLAGSVSKVAVRLHNLSHAGPDDIDILLVSPTGVAVMLMSDAGGFTGISNLTLTFDDNAPSEIPDNAMLVSGTYRPANHATAGDPFPAPAPAGPYPTRPLADFNGINPNGVWSLYVLDDERGDAGAINGGWSLIITTSGTVDAAADLSIAATDSPDPVVVGNPLTYNLVVANHGPGRATNVVVTHQLPEGASFVSASTSQGGFTRVDDVVTFNIGTLDADTTRSMTVVVTPGSAGTLTSAVSVRGAPSDLNPSNDSTTIKTTVMNPGSAMPPPLNVQAMGSQVVVGWNSCADCFVLEVTDNLRNPNWTPVPAGAVTVSGNQSSVTINPGPGSRFYRLRQP
jgi:uncharacterized repeat protein (TIGR01451 family)/uncharacterized delta-60 repeat protein